MFCSKSQGWEFSSSSKSSDEIFIARCRQQRM